MEYLAIIFSGLVLAALVLYWGFRKPKSDTQEPTPQEKEEEKRDFCSVYRRVLTYARQGGDVNAVFDYLHMVHAPEESDNWLKDPIIFKAFEPIHAKFGDITKEEHLELCAIRICRPSAFRQDPSA